jgi:hypothetical protein
MRSSLLGITPTQVNDDTPDAVTKLTNSLQVSSLLLFPKFSLHFSSQFQSQNPKNPTRKAALTRFCLFIVAPACRLEEYLPNQCDYAGGKLHFHTFHRRSPTSAPECSSLRFDFTFVAGFVA